MDHVLGQAVGEVPLHGLGAPAEGQHGDRPAVELRHRPRSGIALRHLFLRPRHAAHEPVSLSRNGDDAVRSYELAQSGDMHLQVVLFHHHAGPDLPEEFGFGDEHAGAVHQRAQHVESAGAQCHRAPVGEQLPLAHSQYEVVKSEFRRHIVLLDGLYFSGPSPAAMHSTPGERYGRVDVIGCNQSESAVPAPQILGSNRSHKKQNPRS